MEDSDEEEDFLKSYFKWERTSVKKYLFKLSSNEERFFERLWAKNNDGEKSIDSEEDEEPYWMELEEDDNKRGGVLVFDEVSQVELEEKAKAMKEHLKLTTNHNTVA